MTYLTIDLIVRRLEDIGHEVHMVRNITDVDDSILPKARELGVNFLELAASETARFQADLLSLGARPAIAEPKATESIDAIIEVVTTLRDRGHTYQVDGITYFDAASFPEYGKLSHYSTEEMVELARERGGTPDDPRQRNPLDFIVWQPSADDEPSWASPFGPGRPGWHIECTAMSWSAFGEPIDLHAGGDDLIFPHHESEIAQSEAAHGTPFVHHWFHVGMVRYEGTKMSKSLGNLVFVSDLRQTYDARAIRLALMAHHYRAGFEWFDDDIHDGDERLARLIAAFDSQGGPGPEPFIQRVRNAVDDDLDTATARDVLDELAIAILADDGSSSDAAAGLAKAASIIGIELIGQ
jgi:L-cysteine:1D-myo-inositol 2-amino-2-deoxy-alpha-D-glucopyranoside ligase